MKYYTTNSREETVNLGYSLGKLLATGDVVALTGDLGAGKTAFTNGIAAALGIEGCVTSPTFTIINEYEGEIPLYHFDVYRIAHPDEMFEIGFEEYLEGSGIVVMEWADMVGSLLPEERIEVDIKKDISKGEDVRNISFRFIGTKYNRLEDIFKLRNHLGY